MYNLSKVKKNVMLSDINGMAFITDYQFHNTFTKLCRSAEEIYCTETNIVKKKKERRPLLQLHFISVNNALIDVTVMCSTCTRHMG